MKLPISIHEESLDFISIDDLSLQMNRNAENMTLAVNCSSNIIVALHVTKLCCDLEGEVFEL
jgi:hypothetical protein